jgi:hypothetical protein
MVRTEARVCDFGWKAADFDLPGVDGARHTLASARGPNGLLVMFICNSLDRLLDQVEKLGVLRFAALSNAQHFRAGRKRLDDKPRFHVSR